MKTLPLLFVAVLLAAIAGAAASAVVAGSVLTDPGTAPATGGESAELSRLTRAVEALTAKQTELERALEEASMAPASGDPGRVVVGEIEAIVARLLEERSAALVAQAAGDEERDQAAELERALALLEDPDLSELDLQALWRELADKGLTDDIIAEYERRAEMDPNNPEAHVTLGSMYLQKIFEVGNSPEAGKWATQADRAFDAALAIDETHWEARFSKATSLSFWPPVFGKQGEAIQHYQVLVDQQGTMPKEGRFAQTHLLLGNMYQQTGNMEKAIAAWQHGLSMFPDDESLLQQLELARQRDE